MRHSGAVRILVAEDDPDDRMLIEEAFAEAELVEVDVEFVEDGEQLIAYLEAKRQDSQSGRSTLPGLILLDLNMPRMDGREALRRIKAHEGLSSVPVVALTTSRAEQDVEACYGSGVNSYIAKPDNFDELVAIVRGIEDYWFRTVRLPPMCARYVDG